MLSKLRLLKRPAWLGYLDARPVHYLLDLLLLAVTAVALSAWLNIQYPIPINIWTHLRVALEVPLAFALLALAQRFGVRLRWWFFAVVALLVLLVRLFMTADNVSHRFISGISASRSTCVWCRNFSA